MLREAVPDIEKRFEDLHGKCAARSSIISNTVWLSQVARAPESSVVTHRAHFRCYHSHGRDPVQIFCQKKIFDILPRSEISGFQQPTETLMTSVS